MANNGNKPVRRKRTVADRKRIKARTRNLNMAAHRNYMKELERAHAAALFAPAKKDIEITEKV